MENITLNYLTRAETGLFITILVYFLMNGAQIFETVVLVPKWTASPPETLKFLIDKNGASLKSFWIIMHSLHEITFIIAIIFCWKIVPIRSWLLVLFAVHVAIRAWTLLYFAPTIIDFQKIAENAFFEKDLIKRTSLWQMLNYLRVMLFIAVSIGLIPLLAKLINLKATI